MSPHTRKTLSTSGISKRKTPKSNLFERRLKKHISSSQPTSLLSSQNPTLTAKLSQMRLTLAPIVHAETRLPAPDFPRNMLSLFLLTESQLDSLAAYYSQTESSHLTRQYPATMDWMHPFLDASEELPAECRLDALERLKVKMRMFARFIGMRGADTPVWEYERQVEILGNKARWRVRMEEEEEEERRKRFRGLTGSL